MLQRFNIIIIQSDPRHCRLSCTERDWQAKGKYKGIVSQCSAGRDTENAEEELPLISFHLHSPHTPHVPYAPHVDCTPPHAPPNIPCTPLLTTCTPHEFH